VSALPAARPDHAREIRYALTDAAHVCERLGLLAGRGTFTRQAGGVIVRCPWHEDRNPSCSIRRGRDGTLAVRCHACGATGDVLSLIAIVHGLNTRQDFRSVLRVSAEIAGLWGVVHELDTGEPSSEERPRVAPPPPEPERDYPAADEVCRVWSNAVPTTDDPEASAWFLSRGLDAELVADADLARVIRKGAPLPRWATYKGRAWTETGHRLVVPMRAPDGRVRSLRGCRISEGDSPKRLPPGGHKATGLVMACPWGVALLEGRTVSVEVVIVEGEPDYFTWATRRVAQPTSRIGIVNGSWSVAFADRIPRGSQVVVRTDHDAAGDRYAAELTRTLRWRGCFVRRGGRDDG
jgi:DNA primase